MQFSQNNIVFSSLTVEQTEKLSEIMLNQQLTILNYILYKKSKQSFQLFLIFMTTENFLADISKS